jgi:hypothetical protein
MPQEQSRHPGLTTVHVEHGLLRAHVVKAKLESAGIPVLLEYESIGPIIGITVDGIGEVRILVPSEYADEAREFVEEDQALYPPPADDSDES